MSGSLLPWLRDVIVTLPIFLLAIVLHEVAHGYVAYRLGDDTAKRAGRLTLSPIAHLDATGTAFFLISSWVGTGFGWAKPVPVMIERLRNPRRDEILVTLAGPAANLAQACAWAVILRLVLRTDGGGISSALITLAGIGVWLNVLLMLFNLLPIPPLDGSHVALRILGSSDPRLADRLAPVGFVVLMLLMITGGFGVFVERMVIPVARLFLPRGL